MNTREGPKITTALDCRGCKHLRVDTDKGLTKRVTYCRAADIFIGDEEAGRDLFTTPGWCPYASARLQEAAVSEPCQFEIAWVGKCGVRGCKDHAHLVCTNCGAPATRSCDQTLGPMVCGAKLCDNCTHNLNDDGRAVFSEKDLPSHTTKAALATREARPKT